MDSLLQDLRFAIRTLRSSSGFAAAAIVTLALGLGANSALFSVVNTALLRPLPYPDDDRLVTLWNVGVDGSRGDVAFGTYRELGERSRSLESLAVMRPWQPTHTGKDRPERLEGQRVSGRYFEVLGVSPTLGRAFVASDDALGSPRVVILGHALWQRRFGADSTIIGRQVTLDGERFSVRGVLPASFENLLAPGADLWTPLQYDRALPFDGREWGHHLRMIGRLRPDVRLEEARREVGLIARTPMAGFPRPPWASLERGFVVDRMRDEVRRGIRPALLAMSGAALLLLVIAGVNVANLMLARVSRREGELAVRATLGAKRSRLARQLLTESVLLAALGGLVGMAVAKASLPALIALGPPELPRPGAVRLDLAAFAFGTAVSLLVGLAVGSIPALRALRKELQPRLQAASARTTGRGGLAQGTLVVAQVSLALVLLVGAGLLLRSMDRLLSIPPGFEASSLLTMQVHTSGARFADDGAVRHFFGEALQAVKSVPGVTGAALTSQLPLSGDLDRYGVHFESRDAVGTEDDPGAFRYAVSPGYFEAMGIPLRRGRPLDRTDVAGAPPAAAINESFASRTFPGGDPVGQRLHVGPIDVPAYTVVGVVGDVAHESLAADREAAVYVTSDQWHFADRALWLVVRTRGEPMALAPLVREAIWSVDGDPSISRVATMESLIAASAAERRFALLLSQLFGLVALALAATGIYGVLAAGVSQRIREMAVRQALGATPAKVRTLVVRQGMTLAGIGVAVGLVAAAAAGRTIESLLFDISPLDLVTYLSVVTAMLIVAALACWIPARRGTRVDPMIALRAE